jgi:hypothetical protein
VDRELGGAPDDLGRLAGVLKPRQLDDDPPFPGAGQAGFRDAEGINPSAQHLEGAVGRLAVGLHGRRVLGLQDDLGAAAQVETQLGGGGEGEEE